MVVQFSSCRGADVFTGDRARYNELFADIYEDLAVAVATNEPKLSQYVRLLLSCVHDAHRSLFVAAKALWAPFRL